MEKNIQDKKNGTEKERLIMMGGSFDPLHLGHLLSFKAAKSLGGRLIVILDGDDWLEQKKGINFMPAEDRLAIIKELRCIDDAILVSGGDHSNIILALKPDIYAHGGDKNSVEKLLPNEVEACKKIGCELIFGFGGNKIRSSSKILERWVEYKRKFSLGQK